MDDVEDLILPLPGVRHTDGVNKDINQMDSIDSSVEDTLREMGFFWKQTRDKLEGDKVCFKCKKTIDVNKVGDKEVLDLNVIKVSDSKVDKGLIAFVSLCTECTPKDEK